MKSLSSCLIIIIFLLNSSCNFNSTPKCADEKVQKMVIEIALDEIKNQYLNRPENSFAMIIAFADSKVYQKIMVEGSIAQGGGAYAPTFTDLRNHKNEDKKIEALIIRIDSIIETNYKLSLSGIRIDQVNDETKKCNCSANIGTEENNTPISYSAQLTEDNKLYVSVSEF